MESFFDRVAPFFPPGRQDLHWHILPTGQEAEALAAPYTRIIPPGLRAVPAQWMHCTLLHAVGLSRDTVDTTALVKDVQHAVKDLEPFLLTFDRPAIGPSTDSTWSPSGTTER
ncbi:hypothetical protein [Streptomyces sp. NPDC048269]|uniref:hypothetical protein n=1 Tax=Streptomyces sp. NPDC048269 TaxID=3155753 RepID=UPI00342BBD77